MIRSPADYMAEWENGPPDPRTKKKKKKACKPRTASAYGRAVKKQKVDCEPHRPTTARLINHEFKEANTKSNVRVKDY